MSPVVVAILEIEDHEDQYLTVFSLPSDLDAEAAIALQHGTIPKAVRIIELSTLKADGDGIRIPLSALQFNSTRPPKDS